jgi:hypothetical protein
MKCYLPIGPSANELLSPTALPLKPAWDGNASAAKWENATAETRRGGEQRKKQIKPRRRDGREGKREDQSKMYAFASSFALFATSRLTIVFLF